MVQRGFGGGPLDKLFLRLRTVSTTLKQKHVVMIIIIIMMDDNDTINAKYDFIGAVLFLSWNQL